MGPGSMAAVVIKSIPCLEPNGSNWAIFSMHFEEAMLASQKWGHFDGTSTCLTPKDPKAIEATEQKAMDEWDHAEMLAQYMLLQHLPDSTAIHLKNILTIAERWTEVRNKFSVKSQYADVNLLTSFSDMCCLSTAEVRTFLAQMCVKCEELVAIGVAMTDKDYQSAILKSVPEEMSKFALNLLTASCILQPTSFLDPAS